MIHALRMKRKKEKYIGVYVTYSFRFWLCDEFSTESVVGMCLGFCNYFPSYVEVDKFRRYINPDPPRSPRLGVTNYISVLSMMHA